MARYLVTGGAGFIGSHLVDALASRGDEVTVLDDLSTGNRENLASSWSAISFVEGSILDSDLLSFLAGGVDAVFHLGAISSVQASRQEPEKTRQVNVDGTENVVIAAKNGGSHVLFASSSSVYGHGSGLRTETESPLPLSPYGEQKVVGEQILSRAHCGIALRFFNVYGPRQDPASEYAAVIPRFLAAAASGAPLVIYGDGTQTRDFVHVDDVVRALLLARSEGIRDGSAVNISSGSATSIRNLADLVLETSASTSALQFESARPGDIHDSAGDPSLAHRLLGFRAEIPLRVGLTRLCAANAGSSGVAPIPEPL